MLLTSRQIIAIKFQCHRRKWDETLYEHTENVVHLQRNLAWRVSWYEQAYTTVHGKTKISLFNLYPKFSYEW